MFRNEVGVLSVVLLRSDQHGDGDLVFQHAMNLGQQSVPGAE